MLYSEQNKVKSFNIYSKVSQELVSTIYDVYDTYYNEKSDILVAFTE